ncbi:hypothetical protein [Pseudoroseomonas cervicalis]|uniref:hypothetical protein n=1 Tax=Teichococcus cervicalis TaxID=204525 RepID=UPI0022F16EB5|nr:hypothetical protein [Pseudoroseomonas cervicalis]WBV43340.1 hypothetical protein PFY06_01840 [Pseudoroseomonas cervicalis]
MIPAPRTSAFGMAGRMAKSGSQTRGSFLEKRTKKLLSVWRPAWTGDGGSLKESLFASFSSEKEG